MNKLPFVTLFISVLLWSAIYSQQAKPGMKGKKSEEEIISADPKLHDASQQNAVSS